MSTEPAIRFARRVFLTAAVYGVVVLVPQYFLEEATGQSHPPPIASNTSAR